MRSTLLQMDIHIQQKRMEIKVPLGDRVLSEVEDCAESVEHGRHGHDIHHRRMHLRRDIQSRVIRPKAEFTTYHCACSCCPAEMELAVDITMLVSSGPRRAVNSDDLVVKILQLYGNFVSFGEKRGAQTLHT